MKLLPLKDFVEGYKSLRAAADAIGVPVQNLHWALRKVKGKTFVLEDDEGVYTLLREVTKRGP